MNGLLGRVMQPDQAANEFTEKQVFDFLVNLSMRRSISNSATTPAACTKSSQGY